MEPKALKNLKDAFLDGGTFVFYQRRDYYLMNNISRNISYAWDNWGDNITKPFWGGTEKPVSYTNAFAQHWLDNHDFEADGYDVDALNDFFA